MHSGSSLVFGTVNFSTAVQILAGYSKTVCKKQTDRQRVGIISCYLADTDQYPNQATL